MIASLQGKITYKTPELRKDSYFVVTCAGVGYKVFTTIKNLKHVAVDQETTVFIYMSVSERAIDLFGFLDPADKTFFILLLEVPGIGPKKAIGILEKASMADVQEAIIENDVSVLTKMSGLTEKTGEKIMVALKDKVESLTARPADAKGHQVKNADVEVFDALVGFGYSAAEVKKALSQIDGSITDVATRLREAFKILGQK